MILLTNDQRKKVRRRIEDVLRKMYNDDLLLYIARILHVKMEGKNEKTKEKNNNN